MAGKSNRHSLSNVDLRELTLLLPTSLRDCVPNDVKLLASKKSTDTYRYVTEWDGDTSGSEDESDSGEIALDVVIDAKTDMMLVNRLQTLVDENLKESDSEYVVIAQMSDDGGIRVGDALVASWKRALTGGVRVGNVQLEERFVEKSGFHRELHTKLKAPIVDIPDGRFMLSGQCFCEIVERFPSSIYIDIHEIEHLQRVSTPSDAFTMNLWNDFVDLEKPAPVSPPVFATFRKKMTGNMNDEDGVLELQMDLRVPIHLRYQRPIEVEDDANGSITQRNVTIPVPSAITIWCEEEEEEDDDDDDDDQLNAERRKQPARLDHLWSLIHSAAGQSTREPAEEIWLRTFSLPLDLSKSIVVQAPAGLLRDAPLVTRITLIVTVTGAILLSLCSVWIRRTYSNRETNFKRDSKSKKKEK